MPSNAAAPLLSIKNLSVSYGKKKALEQISFELPAGRIVGLLGSNGAGKTSLMKAMVGLIAFEGTIDILGYAPRQQRTALLTDICYIPDVAILPPWIRVDQLIKLMVGLHPRFNLALAQQNLARTQISMDATVKQLSRGMIVQLHLALISAIDAKLMILDEPTLGLDIPSRKAFYDTLLNDWCNEQRTVLIATHQVNEVEHLLSDVLMINQGKLVLNDSLENIENRFSGIQYAAQYSEQISAATPLFQYRQLANHCAIFEGITPPDIAQFGTPFMPELSDLFVALSKPANKEKDHATA
jgi:ABC-2 type transport system ATP-binding protein